MRLRRAFVAGVTVAALAPAPGAVAAAAPAPVEGAAAAPALAPGAAVLAPAADQQQPSCGDPRSPDFPLGTRVHGGPGTYQPGGDSAEWYVDLANTTDAACHDIHPVLVLVDGARKLRPEQVRAEFQDASTGVWHDVPALRTDRDEVIGVFGEGLPGFTVGAGSTLSVKVRLGFTEAARRNTVVANTAVVQRRGGDGDWVGESGDYRFDLDPDLPTGGGGDSGGTGGTGDGGYAAGAGSPAELARTGRGSVAGLGTAAVALLLGGGALVAGARRPRTPRGR
ncbi:hypothetical protein ACFYVL_22375 [Streptomyces sp. NPDC004111]|uniref:hypothetical protein n=1 Tax=Streptomyces sp. NPDC004111 TaxID=3364690 RepID=UPI0036BF50E0